MPVALIYTVRTLSEAAFVPELMALDGCRVTVTATAEPEDSAWTGRRGRVDAALISACAPVDSVGECYVFICGPKPFEDACRSALVSLGHPPAQVFTESFNVSLAP